MSTRDRVLALVVAVCWGVNFPATHYALTQFPPFLLVTLRFTLIAIPTVLFVPRPNVALRWLLGYGFGFGVLQFAFLYLAMANGMPSGLASLVLQCSAPFTVVLGAVLLHERVSIRRAIGICVALGGLVVIAVHRSHAAALVPTLLTVAGGLGWALGNLANRQARADSPLRLMLWMSTVPPVPMLALSLGIEGPRRDWDSVRGAATTAALPALLGLAYVVVIATILGSGIWSALLARNPSGQVAPFSLAVPAVGLLASWLMLGETIDLVEASGGAAVISGVLYGARTAHRRRSAPQPAGRAASRGSAKAGNRTTDNSPAATRAT